jgi:hypothetical protein
MADAEEKRVKKRSRDQELPEDDAHSEKKSKRKRKSKKVRRWIIRLVIVAVLVMACLLVSRYWDALSNGAISDWLGDLFGSNPGDGFPLAVEGNSLVSVDTTSDALAVLSNNALTLYNLNAGEEARRLHNFTDPVLKTAGRYALVAEIGATRLILEKRSGTVLEFSAPAAIVTVALAENGNFAVATGADKSHTSKVAVYDPKGKEIYSWVSAELHIVDVALDETGEHLAVLGIGAQNGALHSELIIIDIKSEVPVRYAVEQTLLCAVSFMQDNTVAAVASDALWLAKTDGSGKKVYSYTDRELVSFAFAEDMVGLVLKPYGSADGGEWLMLDLAGNTLQDVSFSDGFRYLTAANGQFYLLTDQQLALYNKNGCAAKGSVGSDSRIVVVLDGDPLVVGLTAISACDWENEAG